MNATEGKIAVLVDARLHNELVLRTRDTADVSPIFENVVRDFLERTEGDNVMWSARYVQEFEAQRANYSVQKFGDPAKGFHWDAVFLPNGTDLRMSYKGKDYFAQIVRQRLMFKGEELSPSQFASAVAANTSRNAWVSIEIRIPGSTEFVLADVLRKQARGYGTL